MSKYLGNQCRERGLVNSIRDSYYSKDQDREEITFAEHQMKRRGKLSFKDEIKTYIRLAMNDSQTKTVQDVVDILKDVYGMDIRWKGKTISYALPYDLNKGGKTKAVRGSKLGKRFTVEGMEQYLQEKERKHLEYQRTDWEIEESKLRVDDYFEWKNRQQRINPSIKPLTNLWKRKIFWRMIQIRSMVVHFRIFINSGKGLRKSQRWKNQLIIRSFL